VDIQEVPTVVLEFSPGLLRLYGLWHCYDEAVTLLPVGMDVFCDLLPMLQQNFTVLWRIQIFTALLKIG
jgi:hypothetical protein